MTHRTTFALDEATVARIRQLAEQWQVSQAEVIRRAVAQSGQPPRPDPIALLDALQAAGGGLSGDDAAACLDLARRARQTWRNQ